MFSLDVCSLNTAFSAALMINGFWSLNSSLNWRSVICRMRGMLHLSRGGLAAEASQVS
jgi:hypothetical protein